MFFSLDRFTLTLVFNRYEKEFGPGRRRYAEKTFEDWRTGRVKMGGEISDRLVRIVPAFLNFDQKYELIQKLWSRCRQKTTLSVTISPESGLDHAIETVKTALDSVAAQDIPPAVAERLEWLAADDCVAAQALLEEVAKREGQIAVQTLETELRQLLAIAKRHSDKAVFGTKTISLPTATVYIHVSQTAPSASRRSIMSNNNSNTSSSGSENPGHLARPQDGNPARELAPIQNPHDLLGEALRRMSPKKQEEIIGKATDEALRLQVKEREGKLDYEMASSKVDTADEAASRLGKRGVEFEVTAQHRSEHGSVEVTVRSKRQSLSERVGGCFVATACYGDRYHPAVVILQDFRDSFLRTHACGRSFIAWYYRHSPPCATFIEAHATLRLAARVALAPIVAIARCLLWFSKRNLPIVKTRSHDEQPAPPLPPQ